MPSTPKVSIMVPRKYHAHLIPEIKKCAAEELKEKIVMISEHAQRIFPTLGDVEFAANVLNVKPVEKTQHVTLEESKSLLSKDDGFMTDYSFKDVSDNVYVAFQKALDSLITVRLDILELPVAYEPNETTLRFPILGSPPNYTLPDYMAHHEAPDNKKDKDYVDDADYDSEDADVMMEEKGDEDEPEDVLTCGQQVTYFRNGTRIPAKIVKVHFESPPPYYTIMVVIDGETTERQTVRGKLRA